MNNGNKNPLELTAEHSREVTALAESVNNDTSAAEAAKEKLTDREQIEFLQKKLREAEKAFSEKDIALIEMTAARNALYKSLQDTQLRLAETIGQRENDVEAYQKELELRLSEKRQLQELRRAADQQKMKVRELKNAKRFDF